MQIGCYCFRLATSDSELDQVHRLNYDTFVREVPQHRDDGSGHLVDKFQAKNRYYVALKDGQVVGMVAVHGEPPYSAADKLADPAPLDQLAGPLLEVRLLAIHRGHRHKGVLTGLIAAVYRHASAGGYAHLLISAVVERQEMYARLGFRPLGPQVPSGGACFVPMALDLAQACTRSARLVKRLDRLTGDLNG
jgi:GNAT superfamily N-acetyltransferase